MFDKLPIEPADPLLALLSEFKQDQRADKLDLGVGVYRNGDGITPVMAAVKMAEEIIHNQQMTKGYIGLRGNVGFIQELGRLIFGRDIEPDPNYASLQTLGGTGAVRLSYDLVKAANPSAIVWLPMPTWSHHLSLSAAAGLKHIQLPYLDDGQSQTDLGGMIENMSGAKRGDVFVLQGNGHNPTGLDFSLDDWRCIAEFVCEKGLVPLIDLAYLGLASDIETDAQGCRYLFDHVPQALLSMSCSKSFGLYCERTGALFVKATSEGQAKIALDFLTTTARNYYSMPADFGAALTFEILRNQDLKSVWATELETMRTRMNSKRAELARAINHSGSIINGAGMFTKLDISPELVQALKTDHGIYLEPEGRINLAGFQDGDVEKFTTALAKLI